MLRALMMVLLFGLVSWTATIKAAPAYDKGSLETAYTCIGNQLPSDLRETFSALNMADDAAVSDFFKSKVLPNSALTKKITKNCFAGVASGRDDCRCCHGNWWWALGYCSGCLQCGPRKHDPCPKRC